MKTLIFGAKGQLGRDLMEVFPRHGLVDGFDIDAVDIADAEAVVALTHDSRPDLVVNAAAFTNVDGAEDAEALAFRVNEEGAGNVAHAAALSNIPVVYYSTDYVFGGTKRAPYEPDDPANPVGVYARSKLAGEVATRAANSRHYIIRTAWLYGPGGANFVEKILSAAATRPLLRVVDDEVGSPTHTLDLALATAALSRGGAHGTYHAVNEGECSRFEFARTILQFAEMSVPIEPCRSDDYPSKAKRPQYSVLSNSKLQEATGFQMRPWREALADYMSRRG